MTSGHDGGYIYYCVTPSGVRAKVRMTGDLPYFVVGNRNINIRDVKQSSN